MKRIIFITLALCMLTGLFGQISYSWNGSVSASWNIASNWTPAGVPAASDNVTILAGANPCNLSSGQTVTNLTITTGTLDLGGFTLNATGVCVCNGGSCTNGTFNSTGTSLTFAGTAFGANVTASVNDVYFNGSTFNGSVSVTRNNTTNIQSTGNNIFNGVTSLTNAGSGYLLLTNAAGRADVFNAAASFNVSGTGNIYVGYTGNATYNAAPTVNNTSSAGNIYFGGNSGTTTLGAGIGINCGTFTGGTFFIYKLVQTDATALTLNPGSSGGISFVSSTLTGSLTVTAGNIWTQTSTFNNPVIFNKTGGGNNPSSGGNTFNSTLTVNHSGIGYLGFGNGIRDIFNGDIFLNNTSSNERIIIGQNSSNNQFNGNVTVTQSGSAQAVWLGFGGTNPVVTLAAGKSINVSPATVTAGYVNIYGFVQSGSGALSYSVGTSAGLGVYNSTMNGDLSLTAGNIICQGSTLNGITTFNKNGVGNNPSSGGNTFNSTLTVNHSGGGYMGFGNGTRDIFNGDIFLNNTSSNERIIIGQSSSNNQFNGNVTVTQSGSAQAVWLGFGGTIPVVTLAAGKSINVSPATVTAGNVNIYGFVQSGSAALSYSVGTNAGLGVYNSTINGDLGLTGGNIYCQFSTLNGNTTFNKNGGSSNPSSGGNTFNSTLTVNHSGGGYIGFGNGTRDIFNGDVFLNNTSSAERIIIGQSSTNNQFNGNVTVTQSGAAQGIGLGWSGTSPICQLAAGKTIIIGAAGFSAGYLQIYRLGQADATPLSLVTTGTSSVRLQDNVFLGTVDVTTPDIYPLGGTYNGATRFVKTGGGSGNHNNGSLNIFNSTLKLENQSNTGYILLGYNSADQFNGDITVSCTGSGGISFGWSAGSGTPVLAAGKTILVGSAGYSAGFLQFGSFTQLGNTPINLTLTGTANFQVVKPTINCTFNAPLTVTAPDIYLQGGTFNGAASFTKTGGTFNHNNQIQNIFNSTLAVNQQSNTGYFMLGYNSNDLFNDDITVTSTGTGGIYFGWSSGTGTPTLASGKTILVGAAGFSAGSLQLNTFTQLGSAPVNLNFTGTSAYLLFARNTLIGGNLTSNTPGIYFNGATFNGTVNSVKTGTTNDASTGGNTFNAASSFTNTGTGYLLMANNTSDAYNSDVTFAQNNSGLVYPNYNANCTYAGNITVSSSGTYTITFGFAGGGIATLTGTNTQTINKTGTAGNPLFTRLVLNKASNNVTLNTRINVSVYFTPTSGIMYTTQANILNMNNASTTTIGNSVSYVEGPMNYDMAVAGVRTLNFPIGKSGDWRPVVLGLTHNSGTSYTYNSELFIYNAASLGWAYPPTINNVSHVHYWDIGRTVTGSATSAPTAGLSGNQTITIYFGANDGVLDGSTLTIAKNTYTATSAWIDIGGSGAPAYAGGANLTGSVVSTSSPSAFNSFSRFTLANKIGGIFNPLPIELLSFDARQLESEVELKWVTATETDNDHFEVERSQDGNTFEYVSTVKAYGDGNSLTEQHYTAVDSRPYQGLSYYRLKQVDKNGNSRYTKMVAVDFGEDAVRIFPNPSTDKVCVQLKQNNKNITIKVVDSYGHDVIQEYTVSSSQETIDVSHLAPGVYYIIMSNGNDDPVRTRIVVQ